jgi:TetR/AcrR family transcriptional regulator
VRNAGYEQEESMGKRSKRSPDPKELILGAATDVFAERGFAGAGMDEIARRSGVNKALLYYHVGDKQTLYTAVLVRCMDSARATVEGTLARAQDPEGRLRSLLAGLTEVVAETPAYHQLILREMASGGANLSPEILTRLIGMLGLTRGVLDEGRNAGVFRGLDPFLTHLLLIGGVIATAAQPLRKRLESSGLVPPDGGSGTLGDPATFLADVMLDGIRVPSEERGAR